MFNVFVLYRIYNILTLANTKWCIHVGNRTYNHSTLLSGLRKNVAASGLHMYAFNNEGIYR